MDAIDDIHERVSAGELFPEGQCPQCGALIAVDDADIPTYTLDACATARHRRQIDETLQCNDGPSEPEADLAMFGCPRAELDKLFDKHVLSEVSSAFVIVSMLSDVQELLAFDRDGAFPANLERARRVLNAAKYGLGKANNWPRNARRAHETLYAQSRTRSQVRHRDAGNRRRTHPEQCQVGGTHPR